MNAAIAKLPPAGSACWRFRCSWPPSCSCCRRCCCRCCCCTSTTTTRSRELTDRIERYGRIAAQAPEFRKALDAMRAKNGRRFFLKNAAPNLAGAELQELVRAGIESNGGRITTSQNQGPKDEGRFRQITVTVQFFAIDAGAAEDSVRARSATALSAGREHDAAPAQRLPWLQARARPGAGNQRSTRRRRVRVRRTGREVRPMSNLTVRFRAALWWLLPLAALTAPLAGRPIGAAPWTRVRSPRPRSRRSRSWRRCCPNTRSQAARPGAPRWSSARFSIRPAVRRRLRRRTAGRRGFSAASSR